MATIAFIGLGHMGLPMACNLISAGHVVHGHDVSSAAISRFVAAGGIAAASVAIDGEDRVGHDRPRREASVADSSSTLCAAASTVSLMIPARQSGVCPTQRTGG